MWTSTPRVTAATAAAAASVPVPFVWVLWMVVVDSEGTWDREGTDSTVVTALCWRHRPLLEQQRPCMGEALVP